MSTIDQQGNVLPSAGPAYGFMPTPPDTSAAAQALRAAAKAEDAAAELSADVDAAPYDDETLRAARAAYRACEAVLVAAVADVEDVEEKYRAASEAADREAYDAAEQGRTAKTVKVPDVERQRTDAGQRVRGTLARLRKLRQQITEAEKAARPAHVAAETKALPGLVDDAVKAVTLAHAALTRALAARDAALWAEFRRVQDAHGGNMPDVVRLPQRRTEAAVEGLAAAAALLDDESLRPALRGEELLVLPVVTPSRGERARMAAANDWTLRDIESSEGYTVTRLTFQWGKRPFRPFGGLGPEEITGGNREAWVSTPTRRRSDAGEMTD